MRDVHWRAYARTGQLKIKQHDYTAASKLLVLLNIAPEERLWGQIGLEHHERLERAISLAVSLCCYALEDGLDVGLGCNADLSQFEGQTLFIAPPPAPSSGSASWRPPAPAAHPKGPELPQLPGVHAPALGHGHPAAQRLRFPPDPGPGPAASQLRQHREPLSLPVLIPPLPPAQKEALSPCP